MLLAAERRASPARLPAVFQTGADDRCPHSLLPEAQTSQPGSAVREAGAFDPLADEVAAAASVVGSAVAVATAAEVAAGIAAAVALVAAEDVVAPAQAVIAVVELAAVAVGAIASAAVSAGLVRWPADRI